MDQKWIRKLLRKLLRNHPQWIILIGFNGILGAYGIQVEAEKEIHIHIIA